MSEYTKALDQEGWSKHADLHLLEKVVNAVDRPCFQMDRGVGCDLPNRKKFAGSRVRDGTDLTMDGQAGETSDCT